MCVGFVHKVHETKDLGNQFHAIWLIVAPSEAVHLRRLKKDFSMWFYKYLMQKDDAFVIHMMFENH